MVVRETDSSSLYVICSWVIVCKELRISVVREFMENRLGLEMYFDSALIVG